MTTVKQTTHLGHEERHRHICSRQAGRVWARASFPVIDLGTWQLRFTCLDSWRSLFPQEGCVGVFGSPSHHALPSQLKCSGRRRGKEGAASHGDQFSAKALRRPKRQAGMCGSSRQQRKAAQTGVSRHRPGTWAYDTGAAFNLSEESSLDTRQID